ncbi:HBR036Cp [Eremothecium sinecaudum]|uniref:HBR036Cp n=1 Tax=Eremothecium sinecaudum TaxID=45286 RepID=A0A109UXG9_9SACH|nr:HBR036Cp [Eremothecium sinecaudum]AMD18937.1 HBR036Cp [Eremothecium sinecaudum]
MNHSTNTKNDDITYFDELFDVDLDIDFETAYNMISGDVLPAAGQEPIHGTEGSQFVTKEDLGDWAGCSQDRESHSLVDDMRFVGSFPPGLLSVDESYAIENFLDSLIPSSSGTMLQNPPSTSPFTITTTNGNSDSFSRLRAQAQQDILESGNYHPKPVALTEISVPENLIPTEIRSSKAKLRRWKHVYCEKQRRLMFKQAFDELIAMVRFPRPAECDIVKLHEIKNGRRIRDKNMREPGDGKRIPKHMLLKYIVEDIELLILANKELEKLILTPPTKI